MDSNPFRGGPGPFKIVSILEGEPPTGVNPTPYERQPIYLDKPITTWTVNTDGEKNEFWLSIMGYNYTGVYKDEVVATVHSGENVKWLATYYPSQGACTIALADDSTKGWTVCDAVVGRVIKIESLIHTGGSPPDTQLFRCVPIHKD